MTNGDTPESPVDPEPPMNLGTPGGLIEALQAIVPDMDMPMVVSAGGDNFVITEILIDPEGIVGLFAMQQED